MYSLRLRLSVVFELCVIFKKFLLIVINRVVMRSQINK